MNSAIFELAILVALSVIIAIIAHFLLRRYYTASIIAALLANISFNFVNCRYFAGLDPFWPPALIGGGILALIIALLIGLPISPNSINHARRWLWGTVSVLIAGLLLPIPIWNAQFQGIDGYYLSGQCMGGHDIFIEFWKGEHFETCPGHKDRTPTGTLRQIDDGWDLLRESEVVSTVTPIGDNQIEVVLRYTKQKYIAQRVRNPWRVWLPWILPE